MASIIEKARDALHVNKKDGINLAGQNMLRPYLLAIIHGIGYGLMGLTWRANLPSQETSFASMKAALESGANFWNGGEFYGNQQRNSLHLLNEYFTKYPEDAKKIVISIKGGMAAGELRPDGSAENTRRSIDECLKVLDGKKKLDIWEAARVDPKTPIEITMRAAREYIENGSLGGVTLSECSADTIRRAAREVKIEGVEVEFSLWETTILENGVAQACADLDIPIIAYSPLGRGFLTGQIKKREDLSDDDERKSLPRFSEENFDNNIKLVHELEKIAERKGCKPGQLAIAWVRAQGSKPNMPTVIPLPGASSPERVKENMVEVELSDNDIKEIDSLLASIQIVGERYGGHAETMNFGSSPELKE